MRKLAWAARGVAAVSGAVLAAALVAPSAIAHPGSDPKPPAKSSKEHSHKQSSGKKDADKSEEEKQRPAAKDGQSEKRCETTRDVDSAVAGFGPPPLLDTVFRAATDRQGHAFLNDSRNPVAWINLGFIPGAPNCVYDATVAVTPSPGEPSGHLYISLLSHNGTIWQAVCNLIPATAYTPSNIAAACGPGFTALPGTPV